MVTSLPLTVAMLPAEDGDCIFVDANGERIVIDGGRTATGRRALRQFLDALPARAGRPDIDLVILTHVDADHIEGLLSLLRDEVATSIGEVWFNGKVHHQMANGYKPPQVDPATAPLAGAHLGTLGVGQALDFSRMIEGRAIRWNAAFENGPIMVRPGQTLPAYELAPGVRLVVIGPAQPKLVEFGREWNNFADMTEGATLAGARPPGPPPTVETLSLLAQANDSDDRTAPNGASIAFILEVGDSQRVLFAADAHPGDLADGVTRYFAERPALPRSFSAIKVAHHGSAGNNTSRLLKFLAAPLWLFSTNGKRHGHPHYESIARILLGGGGRKTLIFNYRSHYNEAWADETLRSRFNYDVEYGDGVHAVTVPIPGATA